MKQHDNHKKTVGVGHNHVGFYDVGPNFYLHLGVVVRAITLVA
jgi:hypothetical protein